MSKVKNALSPKIVKDIFVESIENYYNHQNESDFKRPLIKIVYHGNRSISNLGPRIYYYFQKFIFIKKIDRF